MEETFTILQEQRKQLNLKGNSTSPSSLERTAELRKQLPNLFRDLNIQSIVDCGCGESEWLKQVDFSGQILGIDIVKPLIDDCQKNLWSETHRFQVRNLLADPPESADLWLARDFCGHQGLQDNLCFFKKFLQSESKYLALTSIEGVKNSTTLSLGGFVPINMGAFPQFLGSPVATLADGQQWFRKKTLNLYTQEQIQEVLLKNSSTAEEKILHIPHDKPDRNAHLVSNVPLRKIQLHGHMGSNKPPPL